MYVKPESSHDLPSTAARGELFSLSGGELACSPWWLAALASLSPICPAAASAAHSVARLSSSNTLSLLTTSPAAGDTGLTSILPLLLLLLLLVAVLPFSSTSSYITLQTQVTQQVCRQLPTYADNVALPAMLLRADGGTDRQTD